jgi:23S rRNA (uracil1939-C5)-methyltransferase
VATAKILRPGDEFEATCATLDEVGAGLADVLAAPAAPEVFRVHVAGALPGERVRAVLAHVSVHQRAGVREAWAETTKVLSPSADRVEPICPVQGTCGSCPLMILAYPAQLAWKRALVQTRLAEYPELAGIAVEPCVSSPRTTGYRNQAKYVYGYARDSGRLVLGAYAARSHAIVDFSECQVVEPVLDEVRRLLLGILVENTVEPFDEIRRTGSLRYVVMHATVEGKVLVTLVTARSDWNDAATVASAFADRCPAVSGVVLNVNPTAGNALLGNDERLLCGQATVDDDIGDVRVRLSSRSFFQVNREVASRIYRDLVATVPRDVVRAVDVYAGAGGIALSLAPIAREVVAIEENLAATEVARTLVGEQTAQGVRVNIVTGDAAACLGQIDAADLVVLNPPRKGCAANVLGAMQRLRPKGLHYLSCDPSTLARDLAALVRAGATVMKVIPYDMMPHTPHVETQVVLRMK